MAAIASGDPDVRQILELGTSDPTVDWIGEEVKETAPPTEANLEGLEVLSHSRIYDLRRWAPDAESLDRQGRVCIRDRVEFRQPEAGMRGIISRVAKPIDEVAASPTIYESK